MWLLLVIHYVFDNSNSVNLERCGPDSQQFVFSVCNSAISLLS